MTNVNHAVAQEAVNTVEKKSRRAPFKIQKTAAQIIEELNTLKAGVEELEVALGELQQGTTGYNIIKEAYEKKSNELHAAENRIYHA